MADFTVSDTVVVGEIVYFINNNIGADTVIWDFGDGYLSNQQDPSHVYFATGTYTVMDSVANSVGCTDKKYRDIEVVIPDGIEQLNDTETLEIYPNPASGSVNIRYAFEGTENFHLSLYDILGQEIMRKEIKNDSSSGLVSLDISGYSTGMYYIKLTNENKQIIRKFVIQ
ncbi:MAG: T9SS type A sorting domain-containing protein [Bacteroidota bacterium]